MDYERIARRYCELMGMDPDQLVSHGADPTGTGYVPAVLLRSPLWTRVAMQAPSQLAWFTALSEFSASEGEKHG